MSLHGMATDTDTVLRTLHNGGPHLFFNFGLLARIGHDESLSCVHMSRAWSVTGFAPDHLQVFIRAGHISTRLIKGSCVTLDAIRVCAILLRHVREGMRMLCFRPCVGLRAMTLKALIRANERLLD